MREDRIRTVTVWLWRLVAFLLGALLLSVYPWYSAWASGGAR